MKIGIVDADLMDNGTRHPNLALMKIAGYHREIGDEISLIYDSYDNTKKFDHVYISKVFNFTYIPESVMAEPNVSFGGTGFFADGGTDLPYEIEHHMPYYDLYKEYVDLQISRGKDAQRYSDYLNFSIGFTTRGCFRKCEFCVNKKYDKVQKHAHVYEFLDESRSKIYLWDDNILGCTDWEDVINELVETDKPFQFRQGLDLRLMTDRKAYRFNQVKYYGDFIFAFDHLSDKDNIISKVQLWKKYTNKHPKMYVLSAFNSQDEHDIENVFERIHILMRYGCLPYIMRYEDYENSKYKGLYIQIARWCNQPQFYKKMSFREFCERNQYYHPNPNTLCSAYRAMIEFETEHPAIAKKYFDLKLMNENIYRINYGYGRRFYNKQECSQCKLKKQQWDAVVNGELSEEQVMNLYYLKEIDYNCLRYKNAECEITSNKVGEYLAKFIINLSEDNICNIICNATDIEELSKDVCIVPRYSKKYYVDLMNKIFSGTLYDSISIKNIYRIVGIDKQKDRSILMEHLKILALLDFIVLSRDNKNGTVSLSMLGQEFVKMGEKDKDYIWRRNLYRLPSVQHYIRMADDYVTFERKLIALHIANIKDIMSYLHKNF
ncbi:MAG TPA: hypothetical protein VEB00_12105 [Clostridia bacterium]|nr:hypothetical protein [Clostridia bacterium]